MKLLINTDVTTADIDSMITLADAELDVMLDGSSMSTNGKSYCSARIVAIALATRDPETFTVGSSQTNFGARAKLWQEQVDRRVREAKIDTIRG